MTAGTLAWGCTAAALCVVTGILIGWPIGHWRGRKHGIEEAGWQRTDARWKGLPETPRAAPGKHRHPAGPPRHAAPPVAGYLPAPGGPRDRTITLPALPQGRRPTWPAPVLEPTALLSALPPDPCTDSQFTRRMAEDMDRWIAEHITATDSVLREITQ